MGQSAVFCYTTDTITVQGNYVQYLSLFFFHLHYRSLMPHIYSKTPVSNFQIGGSSTNVIVQDNSCNANNTPTQCTSD